jgi:hypothetical protein
MALTPFEIGVVLNFGGERSMDILIRLGEVDALQ